MTHSQIDKLLEGIQNGRSIDDFLASVGLSSDVKESFSDSAIKKELTDSEGFEFRYVSLIHSLALYTYLMHDSVPEVHKTHKAYEGLNELRDIVKKIESADKMLLVSGYAAKSISDPAKKGFYQEVYEKMVDAVKENAILYFRKLEDLKEEGLVSRKGFMGKIGDFIESRTSFEERYHNGNIPKRGLAHKLWQCTNSSWKITGTDKIIESMGYYLDLENIYALKLGRVEK